MTITFRVLRILALFILFAFLSAPKAYAGGVVSKCDEAHFVAVAIMGGTVAFSCSGVISLASPMSIFFTRPSTNQGENLWLKKPNPVTGELSTTTMREILS